MSLFRTLDRTSAVSATWHARPLLAFLSPAVHKPAPRRSFTKSPVTRPPKLPSVSTKHMDTLFIQALARAGCCAKHAKHISTEGDAVPLGTKYHKTRRKGTLHAHNRRDFKSKAERKGAFKKVQQFAERELKALVDYYGIDLAAPSEEEVLDDGPLIWNIGDDHEPWPARDARDADTVRKLEELLSNEETPHSDVFETYRLLPAPGVVYLRTNTIRALLHHLSIVERVTPDAMQRFLSILDDMKNAHIHITRSEWTTAIHFAGRYMGKVSEDELQSALYIWRDMEKRAGIGGGVVTFNVLFDVAVKAGKFALADAFLKEMQTRKLKFHRHFRVSLLYYYGVMQDGNGVRKVYQELVEAGDIVDTVVMNAVIAALIRAGEPAAAEHVFERMKRLHATKTVPLPGETPLNARNWRERRLLGLYLTHQARLINRTQDVEKRKQLQSYAPIAPNSRTYALLIRHYARTAGDIDRVTELVQEMRYNSIPLEGTIFIVILHGFNTFGGVRYSSWTADKLERIWAEYLRAVEDKLERTWLSSMAVEAALKAFSKCTDAERTLRAWEEARRLWEPTAEELEGVLKTLRWLMPKQDGDFFDEYRGI